MVIAPQNYEAQNEGELSFKEGDHIFLTGGASKPGWMNAKVNGKEGVIPDSFTGLYIIHSFFYIPRLFII